MTSDKKLENVYLDSSDIKLKINIDTTEAIQQLQRIQKALQQDEEEED